MHGLKHKQFAMQGTIIIHKSVGLTYNNQTHKNYAMFVTIKVMHDLNYFCNIIKILSLFLDIFIY